MPRYDFLRFAAPFRTKNINFRAAVRAEPRAPANTRASSPRCGEKSHRNARGSRIPPRRQSRKRAYPSAPASDRHAPPEPVQRPKKSSPSAAGNRAFCRRTRFPRRFGGRYNRLQRMPERKKKSEFLRRNRASTKPRSPFFRNPVRTSAPRPPRHRTARSAGCRTDPARTLRKPDPAGDVLRRCGANSPEAEPA